MKQELLEYLVRHCVREVLSQTNKHELSQTGKVNEGDPEIKGAAAPPADGQGTADQPEIPNEKDSIPEKPSEPETPPPSADLKGVIIVDPKDKAKLSRINIRGQDDAGIERELYRAGSRRVGSRVKIAFSTVRMVKDALKNPNSVTYLYLGKYDPDSDEIFLMADKSLQVAKDGTIPPGEMSGTPVTMASQDDLTRGLNPDTSNDQDYANRLPVGNQIPRYGIDEELSKMIKQVVNEILDKK